MSLVCFDSHIVIWGVKGQSNPGQELYVRKARHVMASCARDDKRILIPAIVAAELAVGVDEPDRASFLHDLGKDHLLAPFDSRAALVFARMWETRRDNSGYKREEMKADFLIAAIAVANGCECIYSNDNGLRKFAESHIPVLSLDDIILPPEQPHLI